jgi:hypothetical protein
VTVRQSAVTILAPIRVQHEEALQRVLENLGQQPGAVFERFDTVHFARFFVINAAFDPDGHYLEPKLVFLADIDGPIDPFLRQFATDAIDPIFEHCVGYSAPDRLNFLRAHQVETPANYVNTRGRTVEQIRQEAALHDAIQGFLDAHAAEFRGTEPRRVRAAIQDFVRREDSLAWARQPLPAPDPKFVLAEGLHVAGVVGAALVLSPVVLLGLPIFLWFLRQHEQRDVARDIFPDETRIRVVAAQEDHGVQNPYSSGGLLKPGPFRRFTATLVLYGTNFLARHIFNHGDLIGVKTIHFGRWIFLDDKRRVIFASNYDGSLENYMDDFIDKIAWGLNITFSNGVDYPKTNWLVLDGALNEQVFKRFNLMHQLTAPCWYAGYQGLTALNIQNNERIRAGLYGPLDDAATRAWLRRF